MVLPHSIENRFTDLIQVTMRIQEITPHIERFLFLFFFFVMGKFLVNLGFRSLLNPVASLLIRRI